MGSKCCKCTSDKTASAQRSVSTYSYPRSRTRRRMIGDDWDVEEPIDDERLSPENATSPRVATGRPVLPRSLSDVTVKVGTRTRFLIEVSSQTPVTVRWEKNGRTVEENDRIRMVNEGQFYCLDISPVILEDSGVWSAYVKNSIGVTRSSGELSLLVPKAYKKPEFVETLRAVLTSQGTVSLECKVVGVPTPTLRWFKGDSEIKAGDILALTPEAKDPTSLGTYTCLASNCMGTAESTSIVHLDAATSRSQGFLPSGPKPKFVKELRNDKVKLGGNITLECKVAVPPWPEEIHWYGPSGEMVEGERAHVMEDGAGMYSITLNNVTSEDHGTWKCVASNKLGAKSVSSAILTVNYPKNYRKPKFLESLKAILTEEGLVSFECKVVGYPTPNLSWLKDGQELKPGDVYQLTGTNSLGSYCCIAKNCMGQAESSAELTLEDIKNQLTEEERMQLSSEKLPPRFITGLKSQEAKINESLKFTVKVSIFPEPTVLWFKDDEIIENSEKYKLEKDRLGTFHLNISKLEFSDQAEWKCVATNDYGQSVTSCFLKLNIPRHFKKPKFLEDLKAVMSEEGAVNLECKVIGVPQPKLKWFKDGKELQAGDIHKIISGQDGTCCLGTYTCLAQNCMGTVSSSASLLGFEEKGVKSTGIPENTRHPLSRDRSLSTIHEERTSQLHDTDKSTITADDRAEEVSFSFDGKEVSVSLYETPDLTEEEAIQIVEMYADQISEHVSEHNLVELPPMRFTKESSTSGKLMMEAVVIDVSPEYFSTAPTSPKAPQVEDDLRTDADVDEFSLVEEMTVANLTPDEVKNIENITADFESRTPTKPPRKQKEVTSPEPKSRKKKKSTDSEKEDDSLQEFERRKVLDGQKRRRTESELEDDSLYEFESRKTNEFKSFDDIKRSTETGFKTVENESVRSFKRSLTEDEGTFDTAEDSAFDKSEMSVLESLAHSLHEIQKGLAQVEAQVGSDSTEMHSARGLLEALVQPITDVQRSLEVVESQINDQCSTEMIETLIQPIEQFKKNLALMEELNIPLESVTDQLENLDREIALIRESAKRRGDYEKSVVEIQEALTKMIESPVSDRKVADSLTAELQMLEEKTNDELEKFYDRLLTVGTELRTKANDEENQEIVDILRSVGDLVKPLKKLSAMTSKCLSIVVEDNEMGSPPSQKVIEALVKPLDALEASLSLFESVGALRSHKAIRGAGIPVLYKVSVPMEELDTTIKLVENLSPHTAVEFLIPPLESLIKIVSNIDVSQGGSGFLENLHDEGVPLVKNIEDSLDVMLNCVGSIEKGVPVEESERDIARKFPAIVKPMEEFQKSLRSVEKGIKSEELTYEDVFSIAQELSKPLQSMRSEFSILQHEIEAEHYSQQGQNLISLIEPLESVQNCITSFHETVMCKSADDPMHMRFILYALKEMSEPFNNLCSNMIKTEETILGRNDPYQGLKAVHRSVSELRESSVALTSESHIEKISNRLSEPLIRVQNGLENIIEIVDKDSTNILKSMSEPFRELQSALLEIDEEMNEEVTEGVTPELKKAIQDLQKSILVIEKSDDPNIEANMVTLQSLTQPLKTLKAQFSEIQRSSNRTLIKADRALTSLRDSTRRVSATITTLKAKRASTQPVSNVLLALSETVGDLENAVEEATCDLESTKKLDDARHKLSQVLKTTAQRLSEMCSKADNLAVSVEPEKRKSLVLVQDVIYDLQIAVEQSHKILSNGKGKAVNRNKETLETIEQLSNAMSSFHSQLSSVDEFSFSEPQGIDVLKQQVDELESFLTAAVVDKNDKMIMESITNDVKSVQRVVDNLALEGSADTARIRFVLAKVESVHEDLKEMKGNVKDACQTALSIINIGENLLVPKPQTEIVQIDHEESVIGNLLENIEELENSFEKLKPNLGGVSDRTVAEVSMELSILQSTVQDLATEACGELLDRAQELCIPIKAIEDHLSSVARISQVDMEEAAESLHDINRVLTAAVKKKEVAKLSQPMMSVIGDLLESVDDLEVSFERIKRRAKQVEEPSLSKMASEIFILQNIVQDLATEATTELLDKASDACLPVRLVEEKLLNKTEDLDKLCETLHNINAELRSAIKQSEIEKDYNKIFSFDSISEDIDIPIIKSIISSIKLMQSQIPSKPEKLKNFLQSLESNIALYGENVILGNFDKLQAPLSKMEELVSNFEIQCSEVESLQQAVQDLKSATKKGDIGQVLPGLQSVMTPLKILHEELREEHDEEETKYLDWFSKASTDLELGLMRLERAILMNKKLEPDCMASPVENLSKYIESIINDPKYQKNDDGSLSSLKTLFAPICQIQDAVCSIQEAIDSNRNEEAIQLLKLISKPVRELRANIALIQDDALANASLNQLGELKQAVSLMANQAEIENVELKKPLLQLQARLQELGPESELEEVVSEITGPVHSLKKAVETLEKRGEDSLLLELCHQVVDIISNADETLSEMSSIDRTQVTSRIETKSLAKVAVECQEADEDLTLSEMSFSEGTFAQERLSPNLMTPSTKQVEIHEIFDKGMEALKTKIEVLEVENKKKGISQIDVSGKAQKGEIGLIVEEAEDKQKVQRVSAEKMLSSEAITVSEAKPSAGVLSSQKEELEVDNKEKAISIMDVSGKAQQGEISQIVEEARDKQDMQSLSAEMVPSEKISVSEEAKPSAGILSTQEELLAEKHEIQEKRIAEEKMIKEKVNSEKKLQLEEQNKKDNKYDEKQDLESKEKSEKIVTQKEKKEIEKDDQKELEKKTKENKIDDKKKAKEEYKIENKKLEEENNVKEDGEKKKTEKEETKMKERGEVDKKEKEEGKERTEPKRKEEEAKDLLKKEEKDKVKKNENEEKNSEYGAKAELITERKEDEKKAQEKEERVRTKEEAEDNTKQQAEIVKKKEKDKGEQEDKSEEKAELENKTKEVVKVDTESQKTKKEGEKKEEEAKIAKEEAEHEKKKEEEQKTIEQVEKKKREEEKKDKAELEKNKENKKMEEEKSDVGQGDVKKAREKAEHDERKKEEEQIKAKTDEPNKKKEEMNQVKAEEEKRKEEQGELEKKKKEEEERKVKQDEDMKKKEEEEKKVREEEERAKKMKEEEEKKAKADLENKKKEEEKKAKEEGELAKKKKMEEEQEMKKKEEENKAKEEAELAKKKKEEEELKAKEQEELAKRKREEEEKKEKEQIELKKKEKEEEELKAKEKQEKNKKEEEAKKAKEEAELAKMKKEEEEKKAREEAELAKKTKEEEEKKAKAELEKKKKEEEEQEKKKKEQEEMKAKAELEKKKKEEEEEKKAKEQAELEKKKKQEEEEMAKAELDKKKKEEEKKNKEEEEKKKKEEEERKAKERAELEKKKKEEEEKRAKEEAELEKKKKEEEEKKVKEEEEKKKKEEDERKAIEKAEIEKKQKEEEEKKAKAAEEKKKKEEEERIAKELAELEKKKKEEEEKKAKEQAELEQKKKEEEEKAKAELEKKKKEEEEKKAKAELEKKKKEEEERKAKEQAELEKKKKEEEEKRAKEQAELEKKKMEEEEKKIKEEEEKKKKEEEEKKAKEQAELEKKKKEEEEKKAKEELEKKKKEEEEKKAKAELETKKKEEEEKKKKEEEEKKAKEQAELEKKKKEEEEKKKKEEEEKKAKEQAELEKKKKEEEEKKAKEELEKKKKEEEEKKAKAELDKKKKEEEEKAKAELEKKNKKEEEEKKKKEEEEKKAKAELEKKKKEEEEKKVKEEDEKKAKEQAELEKKKKEKEEEKAKAELEKKKKEEEEKKAKAELEKKKKEEEEKAKTELEKKNKKAEEEKKKKEEEEERKAKEQAELEKKKKEEEEKKAKAELEKKKKEEEEKIKKEEEEKKKKEEDERKAKEQAEIEKKKKEEEEKKVKAAEEKKKKEDEEKKAKEQAKLEKKKKEEEEKKSKEQAELEKKRKEEEEKKAKAAEEKKKKEEEEKKAKEHAELEKKKKEEEEKKAKEELEQKKKKEEEEKKLKESNKKKEEEEKKAKEQAELEKKKKEEEEKKAKADLEKKKKEEEEEKVKEEKKKKEEEEKKAKAELEKNKKEEDEKKAKEQAELEKKKKEEEGKKKNEKEEKVKEEEKKKKKEEDEKNAKAELEKKKEEDDRKAEEEKKKKLEEDKKAKSKLEKKKANVEEENDKKKEDQMKSKGESEKKKIVEDEQKDKFESDKQKKEEESIGGKQKIKEDTKKATEQAELSLKVKSKELAQLEESAYTTRKEVDTKIVESSFLEKQKKDNKIDENDYKKKKDVSLKIDEDVSTNFERKSKFEKATESDERYFSAVIKHEKDSRNVKERKDYESSFSETHKSKYGHETDKSVHFSQHNSRGIEVVELPDYEAPVRPQRTRRGHESRKDLYKEQTVQKTEKISAYQWDKSKEKSWTHLEYPALDLQSPSSYRQPSPRKTVSMLDSIRYQPTPKYQQRAKRSVSPIMEIKSSSTYGSSLSLSSRRHLDELAAARLRPPTPTRSLSSLRSRSITRIDQIEKRAYICSGLLDKTVVHGGMIRLTCNIAGDPEPSIEWLKDGKPLALHTEGSRYKTEWHYGVASLEIPNALLSDAGQYTCIVKNTNGQQATTSTVRVALKRDNEEWSSLEPEFETDIPREVCLSIKGADIGMPRVTGLIADPIVPCGSTIALHVQVAGCHRPDITWLKGGAPLPRFSPRVHYFEDSGLYTLLLEGATPAESGVYTCRVASGRRGAVDTTAMVQVVEKRGHEKPALFTVKPDTRMSLTTGEDMTLTCYVSGEPRPQVTLMKGIKDITTSCRTLKETFGEYVRLTLKRINSDDRGTYFIVAKNIYGTDRAFVTLQIRDRARSLTPSWSESRDSLTSLFKETHYVPHRSTTSLNTSQLSLCE